MTSTTMPTIFALTVLEELHSLKCSSSADEFVREFGLVWPIAVVVVTTLVDLLVGILRFICVKSEKLVVVQDRCLGGAWTSRQWKGETG